MKNKNELKPVTGAVMVVGGGIAGVQSALDLADSGFYVYLVEKSPSIGGVMAQLDKTFPTNDCSMCILSPKLVECGSHPNIELLTLSELTRLDGDVGRFKATVLQHPRYIDLAKCTGCGECASVCPVERKNEFDDGLSMRKAAYKRYPQAVPGGFSIEKRGTSPCKAACPAHISVQGYVALAAQGKYREALALVKEENPLPAICGRVCHHPCESVCTRGMVDEPVAIDFIKRFIADLDLNSSTRCIPEIKQQRDEKVAIIGAGPAGLSCAYYLAIEGYRVTVFEKLPVLGGMLAVGIPSYRLPRETIEAEIQVIRDMGVEFKTGVEIGKDFTIAQLRESGYKAFFLGIGAHECKVLGVEGENLEGVYPGVDYLREVNLGKSVPLGDRVAVIGGGNVAMDAVRTARRNGSRQPFILYRRSLDEMPASKEELEECHEEGIEVTTLAAPTRIIGEGGRVKAIECIRMSLGPPDSSGRRRPVPIKGSEYVLEVDAVIPAIGQESDWACLTPECVCTLSDWNTLKVDSLTLQSDDPDIFAGGDAVTGPKTVIEAISAGKQAAISIDRFITGRDLREGREREWIAVQDVATEGYDRVPRELMPRLDPKTRIGSFDEVQLGFTEEQVRREAQRCLDCGICSECYQCVTACKAGAVNHDQGPVERSIDVGSVILAPGFKAFDPIVYDTYGYGKYPNVITSMEFERVLSASGPYEGHLVRPSDGTPPKKIAWLQCVGSRDIHRGAHGYCSGVCCMYAIKEAVIAKEHAHGDLDTAIFFMDMRTYGKEFERYYNRARNETGVRFIRSRVHTISPAPNDRLSICFANESGEQREEEFDLVVLSVGMEVPSDAVALAKRLGISLDGSNFTAPPAFEPVATSRLGVYACGVFHGPMDIPLAVTEASAAACAAAVDLADARGTQVKVKELPPERDITGEAPRIGVFVCHCGINIGSVVDVPAVRAYAKGLPFVAYVAENLFTCSQDTQKLIREAIAEHGLNRIVVAACTPRTHEPLFQETIREAGMNRYLFELANIRDQDSWVHQAEPEKATQKAKDLVRMAVAKVALLEPIEKLRVELNQSALVIGGGVAGMSAALNLADQGFKTYLVEEKNELGGHALKIKRTWRGEEVGPFVAQMRDRVMNHENIEALVGARILDVEGFIGQFRTTVQTNGKERDLEHGVTVLATGAHSLKPDEYLYGRSARVTRWHELEKLFDEKPEELERAEAVAFIQCVGSREPQRPYCSKVCCTTSVQQAVELKTRKPDLDVYILYRDLRTYGQREDLYRKALELGVLFIRYSYDEKPRVEEIPGTEKLRITVRDHVLGRPVQLAVDYVNLATAIIAEGQETLARLFKVPLNEDGFFLEAHMKLRPVDFATDGVFITGLAHYPKPIDESISQAQAAAARAGSVLAKPFVEVPPVVSMVDQDLCIGCGLCEAVCPFGAIRLHKVIGKGFRAETISASCKGCGVCSASCPQKAIDMKHFRGRQIVAAIRAGGQRG